MDKKGHLPYPIECGAWDYAKCGDVERLLCRIQYRKVKSFSSVARVKHNESERTRVLSRFCFSSYSARHRHTRYDEPWSSDVTYLPTHLGPTSQLCVWDGMNEARTRVQWSQYRCRTRGQHVSYLGGVGHAIISSAMTWNGCDATYSTRKVNSSCTIAQWLK